MVKKTEPAALPFHCSVCAKPYRLRGSLRSHERSRHQIYLRGPEQQKLGDPIVVGSPVTITVANEGTARQVLSYGVPMAEVIECVTSALRQHLLQGGPAAK